MPATMIRLLLLIAFLFPLTLQAANVKVVEVKGGIGPASQDLILTAIQTAEKQGDALLVLELNTPGGLSDSMREIVRAILASKVPVMTYVSPQGARAASAGTYILYASHLSAMAPATNLGAATPVNISSPASFPSSGNNDSVMDKKIVNDAVAYIRGLAEKRNRNADWAEAAVRAGESLTATAALEEGVIDFIAADLESLLEKINGSRVEVNGAIKEIALDNIVLERVRPDWRQEILAWITDPTIAYILMLLGIYGLIFELSNPGAILPGVVGAVALMLALYAFQLLPVSSAGLALTVIGLFFIIAELFVTSAGVLGLGGVIAFVAGSIMLFDDRYLAVSLPLIGGIALVAAGFLLWVLTRVMKIRNAAKVSGREAMINARARVIEWSEGKGRVRYEGESWLALSEAPLIVGQQVVIKRIDELSLYIEPVKELKND